nr:MAG: GCN5 family acetyltransferase [Vulcanisaeta sp. AZ3]
MNDLIFRKAQPNDIEEIIGFTQNTFQWGDYVPKAIHEWVREGKAYVALMNGKVVAVAAITLVERAAYLHGMRVRPENRRTGIGEAMTRFLIEESRRLGAEIVTLLVAEWNTPSLNLVHKVGFKEALEVYGGVPTRVKPTKCLSPEEAVGALEEALRSTGGFACLPDDPWTCVRASPQLLLSRALPCVGRGGLYVGRFSFGAAYMDVDGDAVALSN